jgi:hypothetical protein
MSALRAWHLTQREGLLFGTSILRLPTANLLAGELVGLHQTDTDRWDIYFGPLKPAVLDSYTRRLIHLPKNKKRQQSSKDDAPQNEKV